MSRRALIIDDNRSLAEDLGEILAAEGYEVQVFHDPLEARRRAPELHFDVAVLDVRMPGIDGVALHRELLASHPHSSFVLMTAYAEDDRLAQALSAGVRCVLTKPVPIDELLRAVDSAERSSRELLLVDDDGAFREVLGEVLQESGYHVRSAGSASEARRLFEPGLLATIVDIHLPDADGVELAMELACASSSPVVLITGFEIAQHDQLLMEQFGTRAHLLLKPFSPLRLLDILGKIRGDGS